MSYSIEQLREKSIPLPITQVAIMAAEIFAEEQPTLSKKRQIYLNTLAVCVVNNYMEMMQIPTELKASDSWNPVIRLCFDVADLKLAKLGHLECRPIKPVSLGNPDAVLCNIPGDMPEDRIGFMVVEVDEVRWEANLLGFAKTVSSGELSITQLFRMNEFGKHLKEVATRNIKKTKELINLRQWLQDIFEPDWQPVETFLNIVSDDLVPSFRNISSDALSTNKERGKLIELGGQTTVQSIVLVVEIVPLETESEFDIKVRVVHARGLQTHLPPQLYISILDADKVQVMGTDAEGEYRSIQLPFKCEPGERFSVKLALDNVSVIEEFVI